MNSPVELSLQHLQGLRGITEEARHLPESFLMTCCVQWERLAARRKEAPLARAIESDAQGKMGSHRAEMKAEGGIS